jgi:hypothetical protein
VAGTERARGGGLQLGVVVVGPVWLVRIEVTNHAQIEVPARDLGTEAAVDIDLGVCLVVAEVDVGGPGPGIEGAVGQVDAGREGRIFLGLADAPET